MLIRTYKRSQYSTDIRKCYCAIRNCRIELLLDHPNLVTAIENMNVRVKHNLGSLITFIINYQSL